MDLLIVTLGVAAFIAVGFGVVYVMSVGATVEIIPPQVKQQWREDYYAEIELRRLQQKQIALQKKEIQLMEHYRKLQELQKFKQQNPELF